MDLNKKIHALITSLFPRLHYLLIKRDPYLLNEFDSWVALHPHLHERFKTVSYLAVIRINIKFLFYRVFHQWRPCTVCAESELEKMPDPEKLMGIFEKYDIISFDIFDTLLLRPFSTPQGLFLFVGEKLGIPGFAVYRKQVQDDLIIQRRKTGKDYTLEDIYKILSKKLGFSASVGCSLEINTELEFASANPYMLKLFQRLKAMNKPMIAVSDMYLSSETISIMLEKNGFSGFNQILISNEQGGTKCGDGKLFQIVQNNYPGKTIIHIGDDAIADIASAKNAGLQTFHVKNVNTMGNPYRISGLTPLLGSIYSGIVNSHLHNGLCTFTPEYEYGYVYGGILVAGFCRWIYDYAKKINAGRIWFIARDGYILQRVFQKIYPDSKSQYFLWSRTAALKACAKFDKSAWKNFFIRNKISSGEAYSVHECLQDAGLVELSKNFSAEDIPLKTDILPELESFIDRSWDEILGIYEKDSGPLIKYIQTMKGNAEKIVIVDIGYSGTCPIALQQVLKKYCPSVQTHLLMGIYGRVKIQPDLLLSPEIQAYLFSENYNLELWNDYSGDSNGTNSLRLEMFFAAPHAYVNGFTSGSKGQYQIVWGHHHEKNDDIIRMIHHGILDFAVCFHQKFMNYPWLLRICGRDAYLPFAAVKRHTAYFKLFFPEFITDAMPKNITKK